MGPSGNVSIKKCEFKNEFVAHTIWKCGLLLRFVSFLASIVLLTFAREFSDMF